MISAILEIPVYLLFFIPTAGIILIFFTIIMKDYSGSFIRWEKALREGAEKTGLQFENRCAAIISNPSKSLNPHTYLGLAMTFRLKPYDIALSGIYRDYSISVKFEDGYKKDILSVNIFFRHPLDPDIRIEAKNKIINSVKNIVGGGQFSKESPLEDLVSVLNIQQDKIDALLSPAETRDALHDIFRVYPYALIDNRGLVLRRNIVITGDKPWNFKNDFNWIINRLNIFYKTASGL